MLQMLRVQVSQLKNMLRVQVRNVSAFSLYTVVPVPMHLCAVGKKAG